MSDSYIISYSDYALEDLRNIHFYIAYELQIADIAQNQIKRLQQGIRSLTSFPFRHPIVEWEPWRSDEVHHFPIDHYIIYYQIDTKKHIVTIVRIFYSGRDVRYIVNLTTQK